MMDIDEPFVSPGVAWEQIVRTWMKYFDFYVDSGDARTGPSLGEAPRCLEDLFGLFWKHGPAGTLASALVFKPLLKEVAAGLSSSCAQFDQESTLCVTSALLLLAELHPLVKPVVIEHCLTHKVTFHRESRTRTFAENDGCARWLGVDVIAKTGFRAACLTSKAASYPWNWRSYFELMNHAGSGGGDKTKQQLRWFAINASSRVLQLTDKARIAMLSKTFGTRERLQFYLDWRMEQRRLAKISSELLYSDKLSYSELEILKRSLVISTPLSSGASTSELEREEASAVYVATETCGNTYDYILASLEQNRHMVLWGASGCGKTALMRSLQNQRGQNDMLTVHMHKSMDSRALVGTYVCTSQAGEFQWKQGPLTIAALQGKWLCIEEINAAPQEALALFASIAETSKLNVPGRGMLDVKPGFVMFGLCTQESNSEESVSYCSVHLQRGVWAYHAMGMHTVGECMEIAMRLYPSLGCLSGCLSAVYAFLTRIVRKGWQKDTDIQTKIQGVEVTPSEVISNLQCQFNLRHLLRLCERLVVCHEEWVSTSAEIASETLRKMAFYHACDIFCGGIRDENFHKKFCKLLIDFCDLSSYHKDEFDVYKPVMIDSTEAVTIGRANLLKVNARENIESGRLAFVATAHSLRLLEKAAIAIQTAEPVLLVGETGIGKTACIQHLSKLIGADLLVLNMNQQSDSSDLVGSFRPVESQNLLMPLLMSFESLVTRTWPAGNNVEFFRRLHSYSHKKKWVKLIHGFKIGVQKLLNSPTLLDPPTSQHLSEYLGEDVKTQSDAKRPKLESDLILGKDIQNEWKAFINELSKVEAQVLMDERSSMNTNAHFSFSFIEGILVKAMKEGKWLLIDEINLAPSEALEKLFAVLDSKAGSFSLTEKGETDTIRRHSNFRLFAAMNPGTDAGKKELPQNLRSRFTEFYVADTLCREDLEHIVSSSFKNVSIENPPTSMLVDFYIHAKHLSREKLYDCAGQKPHYSLRTLCRSLEYIIKAISTYGMSKSIQDGIFMAFFTQLDRESRAILNRYLHGNLNVEHATEYHERAINAGSNQFVRFESFFIKKGPLDVKTIEDAEFAKYIVTKSVKQRLRDLSRAIYFHRSPILLQGPTSAGKTSLIKHIASAAGYKCIRINNHANTDVQEYTGTYSTDQHGKIRFHEGPLVQALRMGHWVILDELNLAPSDVLEALNRLLDDNRELYVPEINETVKPHPNFMLFATQNPSGAYGGRKTLSRAFRNRFVEIYVDDIPDEELPIILEKSCLVAESQAKRMVQSSKKLRQYRQKSAVFAGKHGFITPRDLLKWGNRSQRSTLQEMSDNGYSLLAERLRDSAEKVIVKGILEKEFRSTIDEDGDYLATLKENISDSVTSENKISMGKSMQRLFSLVHKCWKNGEPVLLVGETGCGKTTACQMLAQLAGRHLHIYNCHQHSETSDFIGSYRPSRHVQASAKRFLSTAREILEFEPMHALFKKNVAINLLNDPDCSQSDMSKALLLLEEAVMQFAEHNVEDSKSLVQKLGIMKQCQVEMQIPFEWVDGPLVNAMKNGEFLLVDELSLAEDAVLERLNSVLEVGGTITLSEKGSDEVEEIVPKEGFFLLATMNPGGDFGKRELSPALRNRFTEIWVPPIEDLEEIRLIISERLPSEVPDDIVDKMVRVWKFLFDNASESLEGQKKQFLSIRDLVAWSDFITLKLGDLAPNLAFGHGAYLVFLDGFGVGSGNDFQTTALKDRCEALVAELTGVREAIKWTTPCTDNFDTYGLEHWGTYPFFVSKGTYQQSLMSKYNITSFTAMKNLFRILRAMQMQRAILLEGSPGVGKSSMIQNLSCLTSNQLVRINLSEHTDMMDLLGAESPCDPKANDGALFKWQDGPLLIAIKSGSWVLLDELNLAQQSVLEGLNALLDHRAEIFIPELNQSFKCPQTFKVFATQNPMHEGGGRKGLPKSFLNRFTKVYMESLTVKDFHHILESLYADLPKWLLHSILSFNEKVKKSVSKRQIGQSGGPWDFNFRDVTRCIEIIYAIIASDGSNSVLHPLLALNKHYASNACPLKYRTLKDVARKAIESVYMQRMRENSDKLFLAQLFSDVFGTQYSERSSIPEIRISSSQFSVGLASMSCQNVAENQKLPQRSLDVLSGCHLSLEAAVHAISNGWLCSFVGDWKAAGISLPSLIAKVTGHDLKIIKLSNCTDTSDLLGSFEQHNLESDVLSVSRDLLNITTKFCTALIESESFDLAKSTALISDLREEVNAIQNSASSISDLSGESLGRSLAAMSEKVHHVKGVITSRLPEAENLSHMMDRVISSVEAMHSSVSKKRFSGFSWIDGPLVEAIRDGKWILLEDANLCNPAVLDRLNPLLEGTNSYFMLNESTGSMEKLTPHADFRLFLSWNPASGGEISRAMRNRGVEVYLSKQMAHVGALDRTTERSLRGNRFQSTFISALLTAFAENDVDLTSLSQSLVTSIVHLLSPQFVLEDENVGRSRNKLTNFFSILKYNSCGKRSQVDHVNFATQYARALDPCEEEEKSAISSKKIDDLLHLMCCHYGRRTKVFDDQLEPDFSVLDSDAIGVINLLLDGHLVESECRLGIEHFLYSSTCMEDLTLRKEYILNVLKHAEPARTESKCFLHQMRLFLEVGVPNTVAQKIFKVENEFLLESSKSQAALSSVSSEDRVQALSNRLGSLLERWFYVDDFQVLKATQISMQKSSSDSLSASEMSVLHFSVALSQREGDAHFEEDDSDLNPLLKHAASFLSSFIDFEGFVFDHIDASWAPSFAEEFQHYQRQRYLLVKWMRAETANSVKNFDYFVFLLVGLQKILKNLQQCVRSESEVGALDSHLPNYLSHVNKLYASFDVVIHSLGFNKEFDYSVPLIYEAGLPLCVADPKLSKVMKQLDLLSAKLAPEYQRATSSEYYFAWSKSNLRRDLMKGFALVVLASRAGDEKTIKSVHEISEILRIKFQEKEASKVEHSKLEEGSTNVSDHLHNILMEDINLNNSTAVSSLGISSISEWLCSWRPYRQLRGNLQVLSDLTSFVSELSILPAMTQLCSSELDSPEVASLRINLGKIMHFGIEKNCRSPLDFVAHQQLLWLLENGSPIDRDMWISQVHQMSHDWFESLMSTHANFAVLSSNEGDQRRDAKNLHSVLYYGHSLITSRLTSMPIPCVLQALYRDSLLRVSELLQNKMLESDISYKVHERSSQFAIFRQLFLCYKGSFDLQVEDNRKRLHEIESLSDWNDIGVHLEAVLRMASSAMDKKFSLICAKILPILRQSLEESSGENSYEKSLKRGLAWVGLGLLRVYLSVPPMGYDPGLKAAHEANEIEVFNARMELISNLIDQAQLSQNGLSLPLQSIQDFLIQQLSERTEEARKLKRNAPFRAEGESYQELVSDISDFIDQKLNLGKITACLGKFESDPLSFEALKALGETACMWVMNMKRKYQSYSDILQPFTLGVYQFSYGISAMNSAREAKEDCTTKLFNALISLPGKSSSKLVDAMSLFFDKSNFDLSDKHLQIIKILKCCLFTLVERLSVQKISNPVWNMTNVLLGQYTHIWDVAKQKEDRELEEASAMYKSHGQGNAGGWEEIQRVTMDENGNFEQDSFIDGAIKENIKERMERELAYDIMICHWTATQSFKSEMDHFVGIHDSHLVVNEDQRRSENFVESYDTFSRLLESKNDFLKCSSACSINAHILRVHLKEQTLSQADSILAMREPVQLFYARVNKVREEWPDNELLLQLKDISGRLLLLPSDAPIKKAMSGLELLLLRSLTWEESAASHVSLKKELDSLAVVANEWRKEELQSLEGLFDRNSHKHVKMASVGWLHLFEIFKHFTLPKACKLNLGDILESIEGFLQSSPIGQFQTRLAVVKMFYRHLLIHDFLHTPTLKRHALLKALSSMLQNLYSYYLQFLPSMKEEVASGTALLSKELSDFVQLSKWEDINVYAMRNNIDKANRTLHKLREKHDQLLMKGMKESLETQSKKFGYVGLSSYTEKGRKSIAVFSSLVDCCEIRYKLFLDARGKNEIPERVVTLASPGLRTDFVSTERSVSRSKLPRLALKASKLLKPLFLEDKSSSFWIKLAETIDDSAFEVAHRANQLRLSDKPAKMQKQKALSDLFKSLKNLGFSKTKKAVSLQSVFLKYFKIPSSASISVVCGKLLDESTSQNANEMFQKSEEYFFKSLATYQELSMLAGSYHTDIQGSEFEYMVAYVQNLLEACFQLRSLLHSTSLRNGSLGNLLDTVKALADYRKEGETSLVNQPFNSCNLRKWLWEINSACQLSTKLLQDAQLLIANSSLEKEDCVSEILKLMKMSKECASVMDGVLKPSFDKSESMTEIIQLLRKVSKRKHGWKEVWPIMPSKEALLCGRSVMDKLWELHQDFASYCGQMSKRGFHSLGAIRKALHKALSSVSSFDDIAEARNAGDKPYGQFTSAYARIVAKTTEDILVWIEQLSLHKAQDDRVLLDAMNPDWESMQSSFATIKLKILHAQTDSKYSQQAEEDLARLLHLLSLNELPSESDLSFILHELAGVHELCEVASLSYQYLSVQILTMLKAFSKLTYICSSVFIGLCKDGYCVPPELDERHQDENGTFQDNDGVGMGEGEGAKDVSDKIENEEQVEGLKGDDPENQEEGLQPEENTKGVEMGEDFEGNMFDIGEDEDDGDEDGENEDEESEENLDQQMGDVDETFDAVDERLWNDEDEEATGKDRDEDGAAIGGQTDDMMNVEEEEEKDRGKEEEHTEEQSKEEAAADESAEGEDKESADINEKEAEKEHGLHVDEELKEREEEDSKEGQGVEEELQGQEESDQDDMKGEEEAAAEKELDDPTTAEGEEKDGDEDQGEDAGAQMDIDHGVKEDLESEEDVDDKVDDLGESKEQPNDNVEVEEEEEKNSEDDDMNIDYQQNDEVDDKPDGSEGPTGQPTNQDFNQDNVNMDAGGNNGVNTGDNNLMDGNEDKDLQIASNDQAGSRDINQSKTESERRSSEEKRRKQGVNPHRKFGEALKEWKLDVSVTMDLEQADELHENSEEIHEEYAYDTGKENVSGGPEALGQAHENRDDTEPVAEEEKEANDVEDAKRDNDVNDGNDPVKQEDHPSIQREQDNSSKENAKQVPEKSEDFMKDEQSSESEEDERLKVEENETVKMEYDTMVHASNIDYAHAGQLSQNGDIASKKIDIQASDRGRVKWYQSASSVAPLVGELTEQLRLTLIPTQISKMAGDFRTGKRLNIRKLIPYIASNFKKDKIWLRRTQPDKRKYQILLAVDDSRSMIENKCEKFAIDSIALLCNSMARLEVGDLGILSFGGTTGVSELHPLGKPFSQDSGISICSALQFNQESTVQATPVMSLLKCGLNMLKSHNFDHASESDNNMMKQLFLIVADGRINEEGDAMKSLIHDALSEGGLMIVFILLDTEKNGVLEVQTVDFVNGMPVLKNYMDSFPFPFYILLREISSLPRTLADLIKQFISLSVS